MLFTASMLIKTRLLVSAFAVLAPAIASADSVVIEHADPSYRSGLVLGASIDGGDMGCQTKNGDDCGNGSHDAGGISLHAGGMVAPSLAILGEVWGMAHTEDTLTESQVLVTANLRGWIAPRLWLQGGLGVARSEVSYKNGQLMASDMSDTVPAFDAAIGVEVIRSPGFALDIEARTGSGFYQGDARVYDAALGVGVSWF